MAYLEITTRNGLGRRTVELRDRPLRVGRAGTNDIVLKDTRVSRHHAVIEVINGRPLVRDLGSRRGIKINNRRREESDLRAGDRVRIGPFMIVLRDENSTGRDAIPNGSALRTNGHLAANDESGSDATTGMHEEVLDLAGESSGDLQDSADESDGSEGASHELIETVRMLSAQVERVQATLSKRDIEIASLRKEVETLRLRSAPVQGGGAGVDMAAVRGAIEAEHASFTSLLQQQRRELVEMLEARARKIGERIEADSNDLQQRIARLESSTGEVAAGERLDISEQRITDAADRLDRLARSCEQLTFEHSQVASAVHELASKLQESEDDAAKVKAVVDRVTLLEESAQQAGMNARQAFEQANEAVGKLQKLEQQAGEMAAQTTNVAEQLTAHEASIRSGALQLSRMTTLADELGRARDADAADRAKLKADMASTAAQLVKLEASLIAVEDQLTSADHQQQATSANVSATVEMKKELDTVRGTIESLSAALLLRIERLESTAAEAVPQIDKVKEELHRIAASSQRVASSAAVAGVASPAHAKAPAAPTGAGGSITTRQPARPQPQRGVVPPSMDAEQSRQVMSQIFAPKDEQDERYKPVRDLSARFVVIFVIVVTVGAGVLALAKYLSDRGGP